MIHKNERICCNCKYIGAVIGKDELVCGYTRELKETYQKNTCDNFELDYEYYKNKTAIEIKKRRKINA